MEKYILVRNCCSALDRFRRRISPAVPGTVEVRLPHCEGVGNSGDPITCASSAAGFQQLPASH